MPFELRDLVDTKGRRWHTGDVLGRTTLVTFWATWCAPCVAELPFVEDLGRRMGPGLSIVTINLDEEPETVAKFLRRTSWTFPVLLGYDAFQEQASRGIPLSWVVNSRGQVVLQAPGFPTDGTLDWAAETMAVMKRIGS